MNTPRILVFVSYYLPGYKSGGPLQSIANLVDHLGDEFTFCIVTSDRDTGDTRPYPGIRPGTWQPVGKAQVCYLSPELQRLRPIARLLRNTPHDVLYLNSFLDPRFTTLPLLARRLGLAPRRPAVLAPRGEFSAGALALKARKKRVFMAASRAMSLHSGLTWQASTEHEAADIRRDMGPVAQDIRVASNLVRRSCAARPSHTPRRHGAALRVVFLSRISPKKNLLFALKVLSQVRVPVVFSIYGPKEDGGYWWRCEAAIKALPPHVRADYRGPVDPAQVIPGLSRHDLFFLPTLGENFGHVIFEALATGLPVLISDQTPWKDLEKNKAGWSLPLDDSDHFARIIDEVAGWNDEKAVEAGRKAHEYTIRYSNEMPSLEQNRALFQYASRPKK